jgi:predicted transcriptional regulator
MATAETTTLRVPIELRDEIARLAEERGSTMLEVVTDAVHRLTRDQWWDSVQEAIDAMAPEDVAAYRAESDRFDSAAADGLRAG